MIDTHHHSVQVEDSLTCNSLHDLIQGKHLALRIPQFVPVETCVQWQQYIRAAEDLKRYGHAQDVPVSRIGMTLFETENQPEKLAAYLEDAVHTFSRIEALLLGGNPIWQLHMELGMTWPTSFARPKINDQEMNPGIIRAFEADPQGGLPPHVDFLLKDVPGATCFEDIACQLAANLYIDTGKGGGELEIWDFMPSAEELPTLFQGHHDFIDRSQLPTAPLRIVPQVGELILFRSQCVHAVRPVERGMRMAASCFIGYFGDEKPLHVWA
ncbi:MAG: 2OG-Fe(II) oxygenase [Bacteroidota bacterium]